MKWIENDLKLSFVFQADENFYQKQKIEFETTKWSLCCRLVQDACVLWTSISPNYNDGGGYCFVVAALMLVKYVDKKVCFGKKFG